MKDKIGQVFEGVISGVTEWGIYVEIIENQCEGMIALRELQDDFFEYDEENYSIRGRHSGKVYMLGDKINVEIVKADLQRGSSITALPDRLLSAQEAWRGLPPREHFCITASVPR